MREDLPSVLQSLHPDDLHVARDYFQQIDVSPGTVVIQEGDLDPALALIIFGELTVDTKGARVGRVGSGDVIGEIGLFGSRQRSATVTAAAPSRLWVLDSDGYRALRTMGSSVATAIEEHAMEQLSERLRAVGDRISGLAVGADRSGVTPTPKVLDRILGAVGGGGGLLPGMVNKRKALAASPLFAGAPAEALEELASEFTVVQARRGHVFCQEGDTGSNLYVLAKGSIEVLARTQRSGTERLATLTVGDAFGICSLVSKHPRMASCVARENTRVLSLDGLAFAGLAPGHNMASSVLRVALIRAMAAQLCYADQQLAAYERERQSAENVDRAYESVMRAAAALESHGNYLGEEGRDLPYLY